MADSPVSQSERRGLSAVPGVWIVAARALLAWATSAAFFCAAAISAAICALEGPVVPEPFVPVAPAVPEPGPLEPRPLEPGPPRVPEAPGLPLCCGLQFATGHASWPVK